MKKIIIFALSVMSLNAFAYEPYIDKTQELLDQVRGYHTTTTGNSDGTMSVTQTFPNGNSITERSDGTRSYTTHGPNGDFTETSRFGR